MAEGSVAVTLPPGEYPAEIERGPEHEAWSGVIKTDGDKGLRVDLKRIANLAREGWSFHGPKKG